MVSKAAGMSRAKRRIEQLSSVATEMPPVYLGRAVSIECSRWYADFRGLLLGVVATSDVNLEWNSCSLLYITGDILISQLHHLMVNVEIYKSHFYIFDFR